MTGLEESGPEAFREGSIPVLETARLILRAPRLGDAKTVATLANDRRIAENTARMPHPYLADDAQEWIALTNTRAGVESYLIALADGTPIGACGLDLRDDPVPEIGYWLGLSYWGKGYATEALRALIDRAFGDLTHDALQSGARVTNPGSRHVLEKCGFQWTGVGLCRIRALNSSAPIDQFRLERRIWASLKKWGKVRRVA
ncbi:MAG: GNAT family N-acetyltransferase [Proteobacteria bacterium]|nr:GNAT family N-acetyltransferase [Pseudomonadota bacterium]